MRLEGCDLDQAIRYSRWWAKKLNRCGKIPAGDIEDVSATLQTHVVAAWGKRTERHPHADAFIAKIIRSKAMNIIRDGRRQQRLMRVVQIDDAPEAAARCERRDCDPEELSEELHALSGNDRLAAIQIAQGRSLAEAARTAGVARSTLRDRLRVLSARLSGESSRTPPPAPPAG